MTATNFRWARTIMSIHRFSSKNQSLSTPHLNPGGMQVRCSAADGSRPTPRTRCALRLWVVARKGPKGYQAPSQRFAMIVLWRRRRDEGRTAWLDFPFGFSVRCALLLRQETYYGIGCLDAGR